MVVGGQLSVTEKALLKVPSEMRSIEYAILRHAQLITVYYRDEYVISLA